MNCQPPGLLPDQVNPDVVMMICTAGHVDHGKTLLVKMLTGCSTDRLKEEQERGMTIELGFAPCFLGKNLCVGIVDVPGHEKFIKTMVAGVSGIGLTMLVIAADDGIMPQTVEHVQIMELLGVRHGVMVLTKTDLVSEDLVRTRQEEIRAFVKDTFLAPAPICPVSSKTFEGYQAFYDTLVAQVQQIIQQPDPGIFRMPIEQVYVLPGQGTIITGIPIHGTIAVGTTIEVIPGMHRGKIRSMQRFLRDATEGGYGQCLALNLPDLNKNIPSRGQVISLPGYLKPATCLHLRFHPVPGLAKPLRHAEEIKFHSGTIEASGKLYLLEETNPAGPGLATVVLNDPVAVAVHDRCILRRPSPPATVAGGEILKITYETERPRKLLLLPELKAYDAFLAGHHPSSSQGRVKRIAWWLAREQRTGASLEEISRGTLLSSDVVRQCLSQLVQAKEVLMLAEDYYLDAKAYQAFRAEVEQRLGAAGQAASTLSLSLSELRRDSHWPPSLWSRIEAELEQGQQIQRRGDKIILSTALAQLPPEDRALIDQILQTYERTGYHSPRPEELPTLLNAPAVRIQRLLQHLYNEQRLVRLSPLVVLSHQHFKQAQDLVVKMIQEQGSLNSGDFKNYLNTTRKYALALLDYLDTRRVTIRIGNDRRLASEYQKGLMQ